MRGLLNKKALSPVIATVLLIALSLTLASFIYMWMTTFVSEKIEVMGKPVEEVCKEVSFEIIGKNIPQDNKVDIQVVNRGNVDIKGLEIKFLKEKGSYMNKYLFDALIAETSYVQNFSVEDGVSQVIMYPVILGSVVGKKVTKPITCIYSGKTVSLSRLGGLE